MSRFLSVLICIIVHLYISNSIPSQNLVVEKIKASKSKDDISKILRESVATTEGAVKMNCVCSKIYDPVCGSNNQSYYNLCQLECENKPNLKVQYQGNCIPF